MKKYYYYLKTDGDENGKHKIPKTAVTLIVDDEGLISRGLAICNPSDNFSKKYGRELSETRALVAIESKSCFKKIKLTDLFIEPEMKCRIEFNPELTEYETRMLGEMRTLANS